MDRPSTGWNTRLVHAGEQESHSEGAVTLPIYQSSTFLQGETAEYDRLRYIRLNNLPNQEVVARKLADLEGAEAGLVTGSGMAAISAALASVLRSGGQALVRRLTALAHLLAQDVLYGGTRTFLAEDLPRWGIDVEFVAAEAVEGWSERIRPNTRAIYVETLTNPLLRMIDLEGVAHLARENGLLSLVDNTLATPLYFRPLERGFDLVIHSATKFLNGHSDLVAGGLVGKGEHVEAARHRLNHLGGTLDPHAAWLLHRGMKTLRLRLDAQSATAQLLAEFLEQHSAVDSVSYPGLLSHPDQVRIRELLDGFGALLSLRVRGGAEAARRLVRALRWPAHAPSFGGLESLVTIPASSSHSGLEPTERRRLGITDDLVRVAVGIEDVDDLIADFDAALTGLG